MCKKTNTAAREKIRMKKNKRKGGGWVRKRGERERTEFEVAPMDS